MGRLDELPESTARRKRQLDKVAAELGLAIGGCGCCGSPWLKDTKTGDSYDGKGWIYELEKPDAGEPEESLAESTS